MVVSRTRPAPEALSVAQALGAELIPMGSAGAKAMLNFIAFQAR